MKYFLLHNEHPYVLCKACCVVGALGDKFRVQWRDFDSVKQERFFDTENDAQQYHDLIEATCMLIDAEYFGTRLQDADKFWYGLKD